MEISCDYYRELFDGQALGNIIKPDSNGSPILVEPVVDWQTTAEANRLSLLVSANEIIADWRTELQLDVISSEDKSNLVKWMAYIKELKSMDFSGITGEVGYNCIEWPVKPENIS